MKIHCLVHLDFETLGNIREWTCEKEHSLHVIVPSEKQLFPDPEDVDLLIIMGGLMSVYQEAEYPWLKQEKEFVESVISCGKAVYGICFGAQMLSEVLGGQVSQNQYREIGWHKVRALDELNKNKQLFHVQDEFAVFQWHGDTFTLPNGCRRLFESEACSEQGFIYGDRVLALQFHPEVDVCCVESLLENCSSDLAEDGKYISSENEIRGRDDLLEVSANLMFSILDWFENIIEKT
ncbi:type 1 glutamine amidotransferase [Methanolobus bombayensis]|uniref:type 1 glutamine amidotransferase n=1 Tax=Methanolobus bombayensis TaxID=38023 RepID=UPI001AE79517|nr:type 1 glutamine amidotransferase [Methanolobus bombayensis]MBP1909366.1 GMP synthase-like glutamine amidotransferase [Methanolobus bombayensis]